MSVLKYCTDLYCNWPLNLTGLQVFFMHHISFCFSPLNRELVEATRRKNRLQDSLMVLRSRVIYNNVHNQSPSDIEDDYWICYLSKPFELIRLIKRYNCVGNWFFITIFIELSTIGLITLKAVFHQFYTGTNQERVNRFKKYYPRIFESYPNPADFYSLASVLCSYCFVLRLMNVFKLIRLSVINRHHYDCIEPIQLNGSFLLQLKFSLRDWFRMSGIGFKHRSICDHSVDCKGRETERNAHLFFRPETLRDLFELDKQELVCFRNMIDFSECYKYFNYQINDNLADEIDWFMPDNNVRIDPWEFSYMAIMTVYGLPFFLLVATANITAVLLFELMQLTENKEEASLWDCYAQVPTLLSDLGRLIRLTDILTFLMIQLPHQFHIAAVFLDLIALNSRIRKVSESLGELCKLISSDFQDIQPCTCEQSIQTNSLNCNKCVKINFRFTSSHIILDGAGGLTPDKGESETHTINSLQNKSREMFKGYLNQQIETQVELVKIVSKEFFNMKLSHTTFLNLLFAGGGFCVALAISSIFVASAGFTKVILSTMIIAVGMPVVGITPLCFTTERMVSVSNLSHET